MEHQRGSFLNELKVCSDPFNKHKIRIRKSTRLVPEDLVKKWSLTSKNICVPCEEKLKNEKHPQIDTAIENDTMVLNSSNESDSDEPSNPKLAVLDLNKCLSALRESSTKKADPNPKRGSRIDEHVTQDVINFKNGSKIKKQNHLILINLQEVHHLFKPKYPQYKIGFSKFAKFRPKECSGTDYVCVCVIHENMKLMLHGANFNQLCWIENSEYNNVRLQSLNDFLIISNVILPLWNAVSVKVECVVTKL
ncbi:unnamed protein product [Lepeophtheirus salmonis]|uniref:(salmon louse) hypothetical protein n=1 Tax=Lepeophtheirus salmonis TaxID=72036 RepID=A0A7R8D1M8_LEPSM|nr:unnamed protein product [Lepeophtheirus salmonis]CAF2970023.1 unnamed protein product [Lepeophtheirus salmonis]